MRCLPADISFQSFSGVSGMSRCRTPSGDSASTTEFTTAGEQPMVPASPTPFTPSGFTGVGVMVWLAFDPRHHVRARHGVIHELAGDQLAVVVIDGLLPQRLADALRDAAVHLAVDDQRIHNVAAIVHRDVALDLDVAGVAIDFGDHDVRAEREREVRRLPEMGRDQAGLGVGRQLHGAIGGAGDLLAL